MPFLFRLPNPLCRSLSSPFLALLCKQCSAASRGSAQSEQVPALVETPMLRLPLSLVAFSFPNFLKEQMTALQEGLSDQCYDLI